MNIISNRVWIHGILAFFKVIWLLKSETLCTITNHTLFMTYNKQMHKIRKNTPNTKTLHKSNFGTILCKNAIYLRAKTFYLNEK
jgi:hypothetical protein